LVASVTLVGFAIRFSCTLERTKSTVELYCDTNALSFSLTVEVSVRGSVTATFTGDPTAVRPLSVSSSPGIAVITLEADVAGAPPLMLYSASAASTA
jgi:hypothetical protein